MGGTFPVGGSIDRVSVGCAVAVVTSVGFLVSLSVVTVVVGATVDDCWWSFVSNKAMICFRSLVKDVLTAETGCGALVVFGEI